MSAYVVVREVHRAAPEILDGLAEAGVSTVHEADQRRGALAPRLRPIQQGARIAGSAITVSCHPGDNLMIHAAVEVCHPGDLLVVVTTSPSTDGMLGELLATSLAAHGVRGVILDAGVRDVAELRAMGFPVWSRAISPQGTVKASPGSVNVPVVCGGQPVHPGDAVVADDDGIVVVPAAIAMQVAEAAKKREDLESEKRAKLAAGVLGLDMYKMREPLAKAGLRYID